MLQILITQVINIYGLTNRIPGKLKEFIQDLYSGKLHREFHFGPDPSHDGHGHNHDGGNHVSFRFLSA